MQESVKLEAACHQKVYFPVPKKKKSWDFSIKVHPFTAESFLPRWKAMQLLTLFSLLCLLLLSFLCFFAPDCSGWRVAVVVTIDSAIVAFTDLLDAVRYSSRIRFLHKQITQLL